jgi:hypothetical protein
MCEQIENILTKETLFRLSVHDTTAPTGPIIGEMDKAMRASEAKTQQTKRTFI